MALPYYRRDGTKYNDVLEWARDFEKERHIGSTTLWWGGWVSTVWLGLDHSFRRGPPLIFESMTFKPALTLKAIGIDGFKIVVPALTHGYSELDCDRYSTEAEALAGHKRMVRRWLVPYKLVTHPVRWQAWLLQLRVTRILGAIRRVTNDLRKLRH
jgi:hypothetical protein